MRRLGPGTPAIFATLSLLGVCAPRAAAQTSTTTPTPAATTSPALPASDSVYRRARRLVSDGNGAAGRALVDSMLRASAEGTSSYGDALFWRGALSETAADAERDYRRVVVEYPLSPYSEDALLSLAELEQARGDRQAAYQHLQRFVREHPVSPARARAGLAAARLAFEQRDNARGCAMIADARTSAGTGDVELRNQIEYYGSHCAGTPSTSGAAPPTEPVRAASATSTKSAEHAPAVATAAIAKEPTRERVTRPSSPAPARGSWTIQLAAYNTKAEAEHMLAKLKGRGVHARISGTAKPFRVRLDYYPTRQAAAAAVAELKHRGIIGFVTDEPQSNGAHRP